MEEAGKEVATIPPPMDTQVLMYPVTDQEIERLAAEYNEVPTDLTIKANYELCRKATSEIRGLRGDTEKWRKDKKADALAWGKKVDGAAKTITERLLAIEEPFAIAKKDFDTAVEIAKREAVLAEERRVDGIADRIALIKSLVTGCISYSSERISEVMGRISTFELPCEEWAQEFSEKANAVIIETMAKLDELKAMKVSQEQTAAQQAKDEAKRKADEEQRRKEEDLARKQRDEEIEAERKMIAAERAEMDAKQAAIDAERKKEQEQLAADRAELGKEKAKVEAEKADREKHEAEKVAIKKQEESVSTAKTLPGDYVAAGDALALTLGLSPSITNLLNTIIAGKIPFVTFTGKLS